MEEHLNSEVSPYLFNGKERDKETGFYYYGARYYDPKISLWLSVDPLVEKTGTAYQYCNNTPVMLVDPTGMASDDPGKNWFGRAVDTVKSWFGWGKNKKSKVEVGDVIEETLYENSTNLYGNIPSGVYQESELLISTIENSINNIGEMVQDHVILQVYINADLGLQAGFKTPLVSGSAGTLVNEIGSGSYDIINSTGDASWGDGKRTSSYLNLSAGLKSKSLPTSIGFNAYKSFEVQKFKSDFIEQYYSKNPQSDWSANLGVKIGPKVNNHLKNLNPNTGKIKNNIGDKTIDLGIGAKVLIGISAGIRVGIK